MSMHGVQLIAVPWKIFSRSYHTLRRRKFLCHGSARRVPSVLTHVINNRISDKY